MDWAKGYSARYYLSILDKKTLRDIDRVEITGGTIKRSLSDLRESADIDCRNYNGDVEQYIRVWLDTKQEGGSSHTPLFTGMALSPTSNYNGTLKSNRLECYSLLKIAQDILLPKGWYVPVEVNSGYIIKDLLSVIGVPINIAENSPNMKQAIIAEGGESRLSMVDKILNSIVGDNGENWHLRLNGMGEIFIEPIPREPKETFSSNQNDIIETSISVTYDWYNAPNILRCTLDESYVEVRDERPNSPFSIQNRGREVWYEDSDVHLGLNETLAEYAWRALESYQQAATNISYTRRYWPDINPGDRVRISYPAQEIGGIFLITDQNISLGYNARTSEEVIQV